MGTVRWKGTAKADLKAIYQHYLRTSDIDYAAKVLGIIFKDLKKLADTPMLDRTDLRLKGASRRWYYVFNGTLEAYYERLSPTAIRIVKLWSCKRDELNLEEVFDEPAPEPTKSAKGSKTSLSFESVIGEAPSNSPEYRLWKGQGAGILTRDIEQRIEWLQNPSAKKTHTAGYRKLAVSYLQEELGKRRRGE